MENASHLNELALILAAAFAGGALFRTLKQPVLVGYIIVGIICSPSVLGLVKSNGEIQILADLGILLLLFIVGLETDLTRFRKVARRSAVTCILQIMIGITAMYALSHLFDWPLKTAILLGFCVSLSSTAVALKLIEEVGLTATKVEETSVGILIAQDIATVPMILILGAMGKGQSFDYGGLVTLVIGIVIMVVVIYLLQKQPRMFAILWRKFVKFKANAMSGQTAVTALAICFTAAAVAGAFGLSAAYGAFLAGLAIGQTSNQEKLKKAIKPVFDVLIMVFFLSIGLLIDVRFIEKFWLPLLAILLIMFTLKTLVNYLLLRASGLNSTKAWLTSGVLAQIGEFSFLLAGIGLSQHSLDGNGYNYIVSLISLSMLAAPVWLTIMRRIHTLQPAQVAD